METASYQTLLDTASHLPREDQRRLLNELHRLVDGAGEEDKTRSVLELQGLGKRLWAGIDAQEYVDLERSAWAG